MTCQINWQGIKKLCFGRSTRSRMTCHIDSLNKIKKFFYSSFEQ